MAEKFELFGGCFGNGTTICNKAVLENGDYKTIAHISNIGNITWYIASPESYVPADAMQTIKRWSDTARQEFMARWETLTNIQKYQEILNHIDYLLLLGHPLKEQLKSCTDLAEKVELLEKIYFEKF